MRAPLWTIVALSAFTFGCGRTSGFLRDSNTVYEHQFRIEATAERYLRTVSATSSNGSVLCVFPVGDPLYAKGMEELHAQAKLETNEVLANIREDHRQLFALFYCSDTLYLSADVYRIYARSETAPATGAGAPPPAAPASPPPPDAPKKPRVRVFDKTKPGCDPITWPNMAPLPEQHPECFKEVEAP